jgi:hypothetical protein
MSSLSLGENSEKGDADDVSKIRNCLCPHCEGNNAVTVLLPTTIPFFREIIIMTLTCNVSALMVKLEYVWCLLVLWCDLY